MVTGALPTGAAHPEVGTPLTAAQLERYARNIMVPQVGVAGQQRLRAAKVLVVGAGGLGSPALLYLAAAGVGTIGVVDQDVVEVSNLQRQVVHGASEVGRPKVDSAARRIADLNPEVRVDAVARHLDPGNAMEVIGAYDLVVDGTDTFAARYLIGDACALLGRAHVWGSVLGFSGQVSTWWAGHGPCYRCVFPDPPPAGTVPSCAEAGVLGVVPAVIGSIQATEAVKLVLSIGEPLIGRLLVYDALRSTFDSVALQRDPNCPLCGDTPVIHDLSDPARYASTPTEPAPVDEVSPTEVARLLATRATHGADFELVDVRGQDERAIVSIPGDRSVPLAQLMIGDVPADLSPNSALVVYCRTGVRAHQAAELLRAAGRTDVRVLRGGVLAWAAEVDPTCPTY